MTPLNYIFNYLPPLSLFCLNLKINLSVLYCKILNSEHAKLTFAAVLMVTGGMTGNNDALTSVELLHTNGSHLCSLPNLPRSRADHTTNGLITCGGFTADRSCVTFSDGNWYESHTLGVGRAWHTSWSSPQGVLLIGGYHSQATTELLTDDGTSTPGFSLQYDHNGECAIQLEQEVVLAIGTTVTRYFIDGSFQQLPSLITHRHGHACGYFSSTDGNLVNMNMIKHTKYLHYKTSYYSNS